MLRQTHHQQRSNNHNNNNNSNSINSSQDNSLYEYSSSGNHIPQQQHNTSTSIEQSGLPTTTTTTKSTSIIIDTNINFESNSENNSNSNNNKRDKIYVVFLLVLLVFLNLVLLKKINLNYNESSDNINYNMDLSNTNTDSTKARVYWPSVHMIEYNSNTNDNDQQQASLGQWNKCVLKKLGITPITHSKGHTLLELDIESGRLILSPTTDNNNSNGNRKTYPIGHSKECPFHQLERSESIVHKDLQIEKKYPPIKVGVAVLLEDSFNRILLTKRSPLLRIFPNAWVLPGGHMEINESIFETGLRELYEETGVDLIKNRESMDSIDICGVFESAYPVLLPKDKLPVDHHIVVFVNIKLKNDIDPNSIKLQETEVSMGAWIPKSTLSLLLNNTFTEYDDNDSNINNNNNNNNSISSSSSSSSSIEKEFDIISTFQDATKTPDPIPSVDQLKQGFFNQDEKIATGTIFILKQYLNTNQK
ncbi:hypothetical protein CYY_007541 [Polysphondylium violaceum]|uniref:m7GpppN-mRNA hydrolase NUDT17 n=1 Tax=Polysphondylium violaceum TaxID=133409 RepID=A0A8J4PQT3_9MYCE|nr:hypothetical protein CYY_007541 [Polysphondylium violaceum]